MFMKLGTDNLCDHKSEKYNLTFCVVDKQVKMLLGLKDSLRIKLITFGEKVHEIQQTQSDLQVVRPPHKIPYAKRDGVKEELDRMVQ